MRKKVKLVFGWGINDVDYSTQRFEVIDGSRKCVFICPYYKKWKHMIERAECPKLKNKRPTYSECTIDDSWRKLSDFVEWVDSQPNRDWMHCEPDKDLIVSGNKHYSPDTVVFVSRRINSFLKDRENGRGDFLIGCHMDKNTGKFISRCNNPFTGESVYLGYYTSELEAHLAWKAKKNEFAGQLALTQNDARVAEALINKYKKE